MKTGFPKLQVMTFLFMAVAMTGLSEPFDLNYLPKDKAETTDIAKRMLATAEEVVYLEEHEAQKLWIFHPADIKEGELRPCIFFIHGGGWGGNPNMLAPQCLYLVRRGMVAVSIHFRGPSTKNKISPYDCLADCLTAYRWIKLHAKDYHIDPDRIVVSGGSAGGHLALSMVTIDGHTHAGDDLSIPIDPKALILFNPAIDLINGWKGGVKKCESHGINPASFSPAHFVKPGLPETLILSGGKDKIISPEMIRQFSARMKIHGNVCSFIEYPEAGHSFFNYGREQNVYFHQTLNEVDKFLSKLGYLNLK